MTQTPPPQSRVQAQLPVVSQVQRDGAQPSAMSSEQVWPLGQPRDSQPVVGGSGQPVAAQTFPRQQSGLRVPPGHQQNAPA